MTVQSPEGGKRLGSRERAMVILLIIVAVLALVYVFLINAGGEEDELADVPTPRPQPTQTREPDEEPGETPPLTGEGFEGRDPFEPLIETGGDGGTGNGGTGNGGTGNGNGGAPGPGGSPTPGQTARPSDGDGETRRVTLLDIFRSDGELMATVQVDGEEFTVAEGDTFADNFRLLDLTRECGTFVFGDERFTLCVGQEVQK